MAQLDPAGTQCILHEAALASPYPWYQNIATYIQNSWVGISSASLYGIYEDCHVGSVLRDHSLGVLKISETGRTDYITVKSEKETASFTYWTVVETFIPPSSFPASTQAFERNLFCSKKQSKGGQTLDYRKNALIIIC